MLSRLTKNKNCSIDFNIYREILCGPNLNGGSKIPSIYRNLPLSALNQPLNTFSGLSPALILVRAGLSIFEYTGFDQIFG